MPVVYMDVWVVHIKVAYDDFKCLKQEAINDGGNFFLASSYEFAVDGLARFVRRRLRSYHEQDIRDPKNSWYGMSDMDIINRYFDNRNANNYTVVKTTMDNWIE